MGGLGHHQQLLLQLRLGGGLDWLSYGVPLRSLPNTLAASVELRRALSAALPPSHVAFYRGCVLHHTVGDYVFVHAGVRPGISLEKQDPVDLMWIRDDFLRSRTALPGRIVVHGHTIVDQPQVREHRIDIDTGAFVSGRLTCLALVGDERRFLSTIDG